MTKITSKESQITVCDDLVNELNESKAYLVQLSEKLNGCYGNDSDYESMNIVLFKIRSLTNMLKTGMVILYEQHDVMYDSALMKQFANEIYPKPQEYPYNYTDNLDPQEVLPV